MQQCKIAISKSKLSARDPRETERVYKSMHIRAAIVGGGFTGLAAGYELARRGVHVTLLEQDSSIGGLAGSFDVGGTRLEKFYHHLFTTDEHAMSLIRELGLSDRVVVRDTATGMYYSNKFFRLSGPADLLRFNALSITDRLRLGMLILRTRKVADWLPLESLTASEWLQRWAGPNVYRVVWEPMLQGKFGTYAPKVSAVWFWNKIKHRGGSRGRKGQERLAYFQGGFAELADRIAANICGAGGRVWTGARVKALAVEGESLKGVVTEQGLVETDLAILTVPLPVAADLLKPHVDSPTTTGLQRIQYLANICVVLELDRSLSSTYWLNINDPGFPFVGIIEHTNLYEPEKYGGRHIVYLSKYLPEDAELFGLEDPNVLSFCLPHIQRMFPEFQRDWIKRFHVWRATCSQPIV